MFCNILSFRGEDTHSAFIDHFHDALVGAGIHTFMNDYELRLGQEPAPEIERSITESRASIIVFTKNYANSSWCLEELCLSLEQKRKGNHLVFPVYYGVDRSDVLNQWGSFKIKAKGGSKWTADNVNRWKAALTEVAKLAGWVVSGVEATCIRDIVDTIRYELILNAHPIALNSNHMGGRYIRNLFVSREEIAKGSNGTVVFEGIYEGRKVAVKRIVEAYHEVASKEIQNLIEADQHQNIVRWFVTYFDHDFVYIALERCDCTLYDLIQNNMYSALWRPNGYPSSNLLDLMRDICVGLVHLHKLRIIHRDLKPHNVLIVKGECLCVKLADMGISRPLVGDASSLGPHATVSGTLGWRAPEQFLNGRSQTLAMDMFSLGCVLFFCITRGRHVFGDIIYERESNVIKNNTVNLSLVEHIPEAENLISRLLNPSPELRPKATEVLLHPLFWNSETRMSFMRDTSDWAESERRRACSIALTALENEGCVAFSGTWDVEMELALISHMKQRRKYNYGMVQDLLRIIRNTMNHYEDLPTNIQNLLGSMPEGLDDYFRSKFPKLLMVVYNVMHDHCKQEKRFQKYLKI